MLINEIFHSIQGEGSHTGWPCTFVRTTGCQMRCTYCDTEYAFYEGKKMSVVEVLEKVEAFPCKLVEITGGEPLLQKDAVIELMTKLQARGYTVLLETGGGVSLEGIPDSVVKIVDVKCPDSGETKEMNWRFLDFPAPNTLLKFVISTVDDYYWARSWIWENVKKIESTELYFSPAVPRMNATWLAEQILRDGLKVRFQLQLHRQIWGDKRGV